MLFFYETSFPYSSIFNSSSPSKSSEFQYNLFQQYIIHVSNSNLNTFEVDTVDNDPYSHHLDTISSPPSHNTSSQPSPPATLSHSAITSSPTQPIPFIPLTDTTQNTSSLQPIISHSQIQPTQLSQPKLILFTHKMIIRAEAGIFKLKAYLTNHNSLEPFTVSEVLSDPKRKAAM